ncbi:MAG: hypothetical protein LBG81_03675, partial [Coriobacteriaceae bacterium]|nr:hypothetical protein [Coriobacteriaceae bacterium]
MNKNSCNIVNLEQGKVLVYDFGTARVHNYSSHDPLDDQSIVVEQGCGAVLIENPSFKGSGRELAGYL